MGTCSVQCAVDDTSYSHYLPRQGQCLLPAVCQQHPHVPGLLHHGGPSPLTECSHMYCVHLCMCGQGERRLQREWDGKGEGCASDEEGWQRLFRHWHQQYSCQQPFHACYVLFRVRCKLWHTCRQHPYSICSYYNTSLVPRLLVGG